MSDNNNGASCLIDLFSICERETAASQCTRFWFDEFTKKSIGGLILPIAKRFTQEADISPEEALKAFADKGARRLLWTAPNQFWFWTILRDSWLHHARMDRRIPFSAVRTAVEIKRGLLGIPKGIPGKIEDLPALKACLYLESGVLILKKTGGSKEELLVNPYFCNDNIYGT